MKVWFDITNTPQVHFLLGIRNILIELGYSDFLFTAREFSETAKLLSQQPGIAFKTIGAHSGKNKLKKGIGLVSRFISVHKLNIKYDVSISCGSESAIWSSWLRGKKSIAFGDNDTAAQWTYSYLVNYSFFPNAIDSKLLFRQGLRGKLFQYDGFKEDIYLAYYRPNEQFLKTLPFSNYVVVRPENILARYIKNGNVSSITPDLLQSLSRSGINVLFLPRYDFDKKYAQGLKNIFIPDNPINGLDACYFADAVLTGAGTLAREAACLGVPSVSFYAGKTLLAVDQKMIRNGWVYHSRKPKDILSHLKKLKRRATNLSRAITVKEQVKEKMKEQFAEYYG